MRFPEIRKKQVDTHANVAKMKAIVLHYYPQYTLEKLEKTPDLLAELYRYAQFLMSINVGIASVIT